MTTAIQIYKQDEYWLELRANTSLLLSRIKTMLVNGSRLSDAQAQALCAYALATDLNPFNQECYATDIGIMPGVQGYRKRATEQLWVESQAIGVEGAYYTIEFEHATQEIANFDPEKDIAYKATLTDVMSLRKWRTEVNEAAKQIKDVWGDAIGFFDAMEEARKQAGPKPEWWAVGVVKGAESFTKYANQAEWDRHERAKKRAEKAVLKKRFTGLRLSGVKYGGGEVVNGAIPDDEPEIKVEVIDAPQPEPKKETRPDSAVMADLGFDEEPKAKPTAHVRADDEALIRKTLKLNPNVPVTGSMCQMVLDNLPDTKLPDAEKEAIRTAADYLIGLMIAEEKMQPNLM